MSKILKKILKLLLLVSCIPLSSCSSLSGQGQTLQGQILWQGEVHLKGNVVLAEDAVLTIAPGTRVLFLPIDEAEDTLSDHPYFPGSELIVKGQLIARGAPAAPIRFESIDPAGGPGSWGGINIEGSERAVFDHCIFRQADSAVHSRQALVVVENSIFTENLVGIRFHDTEMLIEKNLLYNNGAAVRFHFGAPVIRRNEIRDNRKGLFITSAPREYVIENNSFINNRPYQVTLGEGVADPVELANNYWGGETEASLTEHLFDGRLDSYLGTVNFLPMRSEPAVDTGIQWSR